MRTELELQNLHTQTDHTLLVFARSKEQGYIYDLL